MTLIILMLKNGNKILSLFSLTNFMQKTTATYPFSGSFFIVLTFLIVKLLLPLRLNLLEKM